MKNSSVGCWGHFGKIVVLWDFMGLLIGFCGILMGFYRILWDITTGGLEHGCYVSIQLGIIISIDELIFFREEGIPPTR